MLSPVEVAFEAIANQSPCNQNLRIFSVDGDYIIVKHLSHSHWSKVDHRDVTCKSSYWVFNWKEQKAGEQPLFKVKGSMSKAKLAELHDFIKMKQVHHDDVPEITLPKDIGTDTIPHSFEKALFPILSILIPKPKNFDIVELRVVWFHQDTYTAIATCKNERTRMKFYSKDFVEQYFKVRG